MLPVYLLGVLAVQMRPELGFGPAALGALVGGFFGWSAAGSPLAARLVRRAGSAAVMRGAALASAGCLLAVAGLVRSTGALAIVLAVAGLANGVGQPASNALIARTVPRRRQGLAYGAKQAAIPFSTLLGGLSVPLVALPWGWRWAFAAAGVLGLLTAVGVPRGAPAVHAVAEAEGAPAGGPYRLSALLVVAAGFLLGSGAGNALGAFFVESAVAAGVQVGDAGLLAALGSAGGVATRVLLGSFADRADRRWLVVVAALLAVGTCGYALLASGEPALLALGVLVAYCSGWAWAGLATYAIAQMHPGSVARATGVTQGGLALGAALGPLAFGAVSSASSYGTAWAGTAGCCLLAAATVLAGRSMLIRDRPALAAHHSRRRQVPRRQGRR